MSIYVRRKRAKMVKALTQDPRETKSERLHVLLGAIFRSKTSKRALGVRWKSRSRMYEQLNRLMPAIDVNSLAKTTEPTRHPFFDSIRGRGPPVSTLTVLLNCGLDLKEQDVLNHVLRVWLRVGKVRSTVDSHAVTKLLIDHGGDLKTIFLSVMVYNKVLYVRAT